MNIKIMSPDQVARSLAIPDLSDSTHVTHAINLVFRKIENCLVGMPNCSSPLVVRRSRVTTVRENFDRLLFPQNSVIRSSLHTRYISSELILRTQASSIMPSVLDELRVSDNRDKLILCPTLCFRKSAVDRLHCAEPHQLDIWRIRKGSSALDEDDLRFLVAKIAVCLVPDRSLTVSQIANNASTSHPYLAKAFKVKTILGEETVSLLEAGLVSGHFLAQFGIDPQTHSAICMGIILDRAAMLIKNLPDVRLLRSTDESVRAQMRNLEKFVPLSKYPSVRRDVSLVCSSETTQEQLHRRVLDALGNDDAGLLTSIELVSETEFVDLPDHVRRRLAMSPAQKNVLLRMTFQSSSHTLKGSEVNALSERVRLALINV